MTTIAEKTEVTPEDIEKMHFLLKGALRGFRPFPPWEKDCHQILRILVEEAQKYDFNEADVVRAHIGPVEKRICGCFSCDKRRNA